MVHICSVEVTRGTSQAYAWILTSSTWNITSCTKSLAEVEPSRTARAYSLRGQSSTPIHFQTLPSLLENIVPSRTWRTYKTRSLNLVTTLTTPNINSISSRGALQTILKKSVIGVPSQTRSTCIFLRALAVASARSASLSVEEGGSWASLAVGNWQKKGEDGESGFVIGHGYNNINFMRHIGHSWRYHSQCIIRVDPGISFWVLCSWDFPKFLPSSHPQPSASRTPPPSTKWTSSMCLYTFRSRISDWPMFFSNLRVAWTECLDMVIFTWTCEKNEENGVEETYSVVDHPLVDNSWDEESDELNNYSALSHWREKSVDIQVHVVVKPVMDYYVPFAVICAKLEWVPPIWIESSVWEASYFWPEVEPAVQETEEAHD